MKKLNQKLHTTEQSFGTNIDPYEIIYADSRNEEIHFQPLNISHMNNQMARWFYDLEYNLLLWSDGIYEILEVDPNCSEASLDTFMQIVHPQDRSIKEKAQTALWNSKKPMEITYRLQMKDGRIKWINEICSSDFDKNKNPIRFSGLIHDISKFKESENEFLQKEESFKTFINLFPSGIIYLKNNKIIFANIQMVDILEATGTNEIIGLPIIKFIHPDSLMEVQKIFNEVNHGIGSLTFEAKLLTMKVTAFDAEITAIHTNTNEESTLQLIINYVSQQKRQN